MGSSRKVGGTGWNVLRSSVGLFYLAAAAFNSIYTLPRSEEEGFFDGYADGAWFPALKDFMNDVFSPNGALFMSLVIIFEVVVGVLILSRGLSVDLGVAASVLWVVAILPFLAWPYLLTNIALVAIQAPIALRRYSSSVWTLIRRRFSSQ